MPKMLTEVKPIILIPNSTHIEEARLVAEWTVTAKTMLEKTPEQILALFEKGWSVLLLAAETQIPIAHAAITYTWPNNWVEVGSLVVDEKRRGEGLGKVATALMLELARNKYPGANIFALCNMFSLPIFEKFGGTRMKYSDLPMEVFEECRTGCPNFQAAEAVGKLCCDTPLNMTKATI